MCVDISTHLAGMQYADSHPFSYLFVRIAPREGELTIEIHPTE